MLAALRVSPPAGKFWAQRSRSRSRCTASSESRWLPAGPTPRVNGLHHSSKLAWSTRTASVASSTWFNPTSPQKLHELPSAPARALRLVVDVRIEFASRRPEAGQRAATLREVPDTGRDDTAGVRDPCHLFDARDRVGHEVDDELGQRRVELPVVERQLLGRRATDVGAWMPVPRRLDERLRGIDRGDELGSHAPHELRGQCSRAAADIQHTLSCRHACEIRQ